jgi:hypothetical protein
MTAASPTLFGRCFVTPANGPETIDSPNTHFTENIVLNNIIPNLLNLSMNYPRNLVDLSLLLISIHTVYLFGKLAKRKEGSQYGTPQYKGPSMLHDLAPWRRNHYNDEN